MNIKVKHISKKHSSADGERIYVDPIWTDGAFTRFVNISDWNKDVAPSYDLWRFYGSSETWQEFEERYRVELGRRDKAAAIDAIREKTSEKTVTLLYGNGSASHNCARFLKDFIEERGSAARQAA